MTASADAGGYNTEDVGPLVSLITISDGMERARVKSDESTRSSTTSVDSSKHKTPLTCDLNDRLHSSYLGGGRVSTIKFAMDKDLNTKRRPKPYISVCLSSVTDASGTTARPKNRSLEDSS